jgi:ABC-type Mn2+/Zn2+ transport system ATPase subunit
MEPIIELDHVTFGFGATPVLEDVSMHLHPGQFAGLVGPSGAGKTSLLKLVLGTLRPSHGTVAVAGRRLDGRSAPQMAYVPQLETVDWNFPVTVEQVVLMGLVRGSGWLPWPSKADRRRAGAVLERLGMEKMARRHIRDLSGGQQQRVFLARALIAEPDLLVLDEPTSGVDMRTAENVLHLLAELNRQGITILMTTHDLNAAAAHLPWVICLNRRIVAQGAPEVVFTEATLNATYQGEMMVIHHDGMILVQQRPHAHTYRDLLPNAVVGHTPPPAVAAGSTPEIKGVAYESAA